MLHKWKQIPTIVLPIYTCGLPDKIKYGIMLALQKVVYGKKIQTWHCNRPFRRNGEISSTTT